MRDLYERVTAKQLARAFVVSRAEAEEAEKFLGHLYRQLASDPEDVVREAEKEAKRKVAEAKASLDADPKCPDCKGTGFIIGTMTPVRCQCTEEKMSEDRTTRKAPPLFCSFCGKGQHEVIKLISGPTVFICNECVILCVEIMITPDPKPLLSTADEREARGDSKKSSDYDSMPIGWGDEKEYPTNLGDD